MKEFVEELVLQTMFKFCVFTIAFVSSFLLALAIIFEILFSFAAESENQRQLRLPHLENPRYFGNVLSGKRALTQGYDENSFSEKN